MSCDTSGVVIEKDFWSCVVEGPGKSTKRLFGNIDVQVIYPYYNYKSEEPNLISSGMRILRASDGVNTMVCDEQSIVLGLLNKTIEVYDRESLKKVITYGSSTPASRV